MATTSLWHIEGRLKDLIDYVENPEKTKAKTPELQDLYNVFSYVQRPEATQKGEYVTALNCLKETALRQMILTKKRYGKTDGYIAWHGYQSFKPEEVTPQLAHEIGVKLAKEMWGDRFEIIVTTHLDKEHIHCHFCFNSVSFRDGGKYNYSKAERKRMMEISDRLCREYGLSVIEKPHKASSRPVWLDEKSGKPTRYNVYRADVREAMEFSRTPYYMEDYLRCKGYVTDFTGKHWKIRLPQYEHFTRLDTLDEKWTPENIRRSMGRYATFGNRRAYISYPPQMSRELSDLFQPFHKTGHIYKLYLHYCYLLGYLPKHTDYKPTSPYLKEDLRKLDELSEQVRYMGNYGIETLDDLYADREKIQRNMDLSGWKEYVQKKEYMDLTDYAGKGYRMGEGFAQKVSGLLDFTGGVGEYQGIAELDGLHAAAQDTAENTARMADAMDISEENLAYMKDIAEREAINRFTTAEVRIEQHNENHINSELDADGIMDKWGKAFAEKMVVDTEGVHE